MIKSKTLHKHCFFLFALIMFSAPLIQADQDIFVEFTDGQTQLGSRLTDIHDSKKEPRLDGKTLSTKGKNPVRLIHQRDVQIDHTGPYVQFHNGDTLKMIPSANHSITASPDALVVFSYGHHRPGVADEQVMVRGDHIRRIVLESGNGPARYTPGLVVLKNGKRIQSIALSYENNKLQVLDDESVQTYNWDEIAQANSPYKDTWSQQARMIANLRTSVARATLADGSQLTYPAQHRMSQRYRTRRGNEYFHLIQPFWSYSLLRYSTNDVAIWSFHPPNEVPITLLPITTIEESSPTGARWPWRLNRSVTGAELKSGGFVHHQGLGVHATSEVEIILPKGAMSFITRVGLNEEVGMGGYAKAVVYDPENTRQRQEVTLAGSEKAHQLQIKSLGNTRKLRLRVDPLLDGGPKHADPLDIRDHVDWLGPMLVLKQDIISPHLSNEDLLRYAPVLSMWDTSLHLEQIRLVWAGTNERRYWSLRFLLDKDHPIRFQRDFIVTPHLSDMVFRFARASSRERYYFNVLVKVDGETIYEKKDRMNRRDWEADTIAFSLGDHIGKNATINIELTSENQKFNESSGLVFYQLTLQSWMDSDAGRGLPLEPQIKISSLKDLNFTERGKKLRIEDQRLNSKRVYRTGARAFSEGFKLDDDETLHVRVPDNAQELVLVAGGGSDKSTDLMFSLNDQILHVEREINRFQRPRQLKIPVTPGETLTIRSTNAFAALLYMGFTNK